MNFGELLQAQLDLQFAIPPKDRDVRELSDDDRAEFMTWNSWALADELHEAMAEVGWKPWSTDRSIDHRRFMGEMADALHFFLNLLIVGSGVKNMDELGWMFERAYMTKRDTNFARHQDSDYSGKEKCGHCHRDLKEVDVLSVYQSAGVRFCNYGHYTAWMKEGAEHGRPTVD